MESSSERVEQLRGLLNKTRVFCAVSWQVVLVIAAIVIAVLLPAVAAIDKCLRWLGEATCSALPESYGRTIRGMVLRPRRTSPCDRCVRKDVDLKLK